MEYVRGKESGCIMNDDTINLAQLLAIQEHLEPLWVGQDTRNPLIKKIKGIYTDIVKYSQKYIEQYGNEEFHKVVEYMQKVNYHVEFKKENK